MMVAVGGWGKYWGPLFGALVFTVIPELLQSFHDLQLLIFGVGMIAVLMFVPGGIAGMLERLWRRRIRMKASGGIAAPEVGND
jgi:branched-chain amino acid transport system permease protein